MIIQESYCATNQINQIAQLIQPYV